MSGQIRDIGQNFYNLPVKREVISVPITSTFLPCYLPAEALIKNIIIILLINYITIICINNNNAVIGDNLWETPRSYFVLQNSRGHSKRFL